VISLDVFRHWIEAYGYAALYGSLVFGIVGFPIPDETLLTLSGYLVFKGQFDFGPTVLTAFLGSITGVTLSYGIGRSGGMYLVRKYGPRFRITEERLQSVHRWFERAGKWTLTVCYFVPGVRHLAALAAGSSEMKYPVFARFAYSGAVVWSFTFVTLGYYLGESWTNAVNADHRMVLTGVALTAILVIAAYWYRRSKRTTS
jgi:membrane protein DedA with SNARE-associated domain